MKKKILALSFALLVLLSLSAPAFAASEAEGHTQIFYTFSGLRTETPAPAPAMISYEVNIPATYDTRTDRCLEITASRVNIGAGKLLTVSIDWDRTFDSNGFFFLTNTERPELKVICSFYRSSTYGITGEWMSSADHALAAAFEDGNTSPVSYGYLVANAAAGEDTIDGTYTGTLYFKIEVQDATV